MRVSGEDPNPVDEDLEFRIAESLAESFDISRYEPSDVDPKELVAAL